MREVDPHGVADVSFSLGEGRGTGMRVAVFIDGDHVLAVCRHALGGVDIDYEKLARAVPRVIGARAVEHRSVEPTMWHSRLTIRMESTRGEYWPLSARLAVRFGE